MGVPFGATKTGRVWIDVVKWVGITLPEWGELPVDVQAAYIAAYNQEVKEMEKSREAKHGRRG
jgi:hypothetical protein